MYITDTSQMAEYTLIELTDMHLLYGDIGYAVAREWIVNANVLSVLIVASLR